MPRFAALVLSTVVLVVSATTRADKLESLPIIERADRALAQALPAIFENGSLSQRSVPAFANAKHSVTVGQISIKPLDRLDIHCGFGIAELVDAPADLHMHRTGVAATAGASLVIFEPVGFRLGVELNALRVQYGASGFTDETMLVAVTTR